MTRARHGRFARLLSVVASVALVGPILALSSPGSAYAEELAPTPPAVVETTSVPEPDPAAESGTPSTQAPDPTPAPETTLATDPTEDPAPAGKSAPDGDSGAPASEPQPEAVPANAEQATSSIAGRVVNSLGEGVEGFAVLAYDSSQASYGNPRGTDEDGYFIIDSLPAGSFTLHFWNEFHYDDYGQVWGADYQSQYWSGVESFGNATFIDLAEGQEFELEGDVVLEEVVTTSLSGKILGEDGRAPVDVCVRLYGPEAEDEEDQTRSFCTLDGNYAFEGIEPGDYKLWFRPYNDDHKDQWYQGKTNFTTADLLTVAPGPNQVPDVQLVTGAKIQGRVTYGGSASGQPLANEEVRLYAWDDQAGDKELALVWTDDDGNYSLNRLEPGAYYLLVRYGTLTHETGKIVVSESEAVTLDFAVSPGASLAGAITFDGAPLAEIWVGAWTRAGRGVAEVPTDSAGRYVIRGLAAGNYTIAVYNSGLSTPHRYLGGATTLHAARWEKLASDETRVGIDLELGGGGVVEGTVTDSEGAAVVNVGVSLCSKNGIVRAHADTDEHGRYSLSGIPAGTYYLAVNGTSEYEGQWWNGSDDGTYDDEYYTGQGDIYFSVRDGQIETKDVTLPRLGRISGTLDFVTTGGTSGLHAGITAYRRSATGLQRLRSTTVWWNGSPVEFEVDSLRPGEYLIKVNYSGPYQREYWYPNALSSTGATAVVVDGGTATVAITVDTSRTWPGGVSGTLVAPGAQLDEARVTVFSEEGEALDRSVAVDSSGAFSFAHLPAGKYRLKVGAMTGYAATYYPSALGSEQATVVTVGDAMVPLGNWSPVAAPGSVTGRVFAANGTDPVTGTGWVELERVSGDDDRYLGEARIENGSYAFSTGLVPGQRYRLYGWVGESLGGSAEFTATQSDIVDLVLRSDADIERDLATIKGIVSDGEEPVAGIDARAFDASGNREDVSTSRADGSYALNWLRPGTYKVRFGDYSSAQSYYAPAWLGGATERTAEQVTVTTGQVVTGKDVTLTRAGRISGTVASSSGGVTTWLGAAPASLYTAGGELLDTLESGWYSPGGFGFTVPAGSYKICAQQSWAGTSTSNCWSTGGGLVPLANASTITVAAGQDVDDIDLLFRTVQSLTTAKPTISGSAQVGQKLTASPGAWGPASVTLAYQWSRDGVAIEGATSAAYTVTVADVGRKLSVTVTGSKTGYTTASQTSLATAAVPALALTVTPTPTVSGAAKVGSKLTASAGTWAPATVSLAYQWLRDGAAIPGATAATYTLVGEDAGKTIAVKVTGSKLGYTTVAKTSKATAKVAVGTLTSATPKISGSAKVGATLTVSVGTWKPAPVTFSYQWLANGKAIKTAKSASYVLTAAEKGKTITVKVTGSKAGYTTVATTSAKTKKVAVGTLQARVPTIAGTAKVGQKLTAAAGSWGPAPVKLTYQWYRSGKTISKATRATYTLVSADKGKTITVKVTGSKTGFTTATKTSKKTGKVSS